MVFSDTHEYLMPCALDVVFGQHAILGEAPHPFAQLGITTEIDDASCEAFIVVGSVFYLE